MKITKQGKRMAGFIAATRNEIAADAMMLFLVGVSPQRAGYLPRVSKWIALGKKAPLVTKVMYLILVVSWIAGGAVVLFSWQYLRCRRQAPASPVDVAGLNAAGATMAFSSRTADILVAPEFAHFPKLWITMPWAPLCKLPPGVRAIDVHELLSTHDLRACLSDAIAATYLMLRRPATRPWALQSYTAFRWFCVRRGTEKLLPCNIFTTEHYDRWAILADDAVGVYLRAHPGCKEADCLLTLVQHGAMGSLGEEGNRPAEGLHLFRTMRSVTSLHVYSPKAEASFRGIVLGPQYASRLQNVVYFKPAITLTEQPTGTGIRLLFVGHPLCEKLQVAVLAALRHSLNVQAYFKPHPISGMSDSIRGEGWTVIDDPAVFPVVDLLISYNSTLVVEYAGMDIPAEVHPINLEPAQAGAYIAAVRQHIERLCIRGKKTT